MKGHLGAVVSVLYMDAAYLIAAALEITLPTLRHGRDLQIRIQTGPCVVLQRDGNIQVVSRLHGYARIVRIQVQAAGPVNRMSTHKYQDTAAMRTARSPNRLPVPPFLITIASSIISSFCPVRASVFSTSYHNGETFSQPLISLKIL